MIMCPDRQRSRFVSNARLSRFELNPPFYVILLFRFRHQVHRTVKVDQFNRIVSSLIGAPLDQEVK